MDDLLACAACVRDAKVVLLALVDGAEPVAYERAEFQCGLAIKLTSAQEGGQGRKIKPRPPGRC